MPIHHGSVLALAGVLSCLGVTATAKAQPDCTTLPHAVIGVGGGTSKVMFAHIAPQLAASSSPLTVVYAGPSSCQGVVPLVTGTPVTGTASYWLPHGTEQTCTFPPAGIIPDFALSELDGTQCEGVPEIPRGVGEFPGTISTWELIVPVDSSQTSISAEALYFVYGFGPSGGVSPWTMERHIFGRTPAAASQIVIGLSVGVPPARFVCGPASSGLPCIDGRTVTQIVTDVATAPNAEAAIGFTGGTVADQSRATVRALAYQHYGQSCGYWPDSTATSFDKRNVRDGHYYLWSATQFYAPVDEHGTIADPDTRRFIGYFTGETPPDPAIPVLDDIIDSGSIPICAMQVWRDSVAGPLYSYAPPDPCSCYYEARVTGTSSCPDECETHPCEAPGAVCRRGYCEAY
jgi:hypothetical protein